ncbi:MAG: GHKL domain-containing protein [Lachnospiraceae bacterium]|nr:GHKL domain-containing protein [Lachnospiraceae bacterium]
MSKQRQADSNPQSDILTKEAKEQYEQLVREVRMRQHELGNQLSAAKNLSSGQVSQYLEELNRDQRYNVLLLCGDPLLAGLFYQKCREAETQGIRVETHISARLEDFVLPQHELIAIVGGLLDNAIDAELTRPADERSMRILVDLEDGRYRITVANRFPYVPYETIHEWFRVGHTSKGTGRGLGLAHAREICADGRADIAYGNQETDGENEVFFMLCLKKAQETSSVGETEPGGESKSGGELLLQEMSGEHPSEKKEKRARFGVYAGIAAILAAMGLLIFVILPWKDQGLYGDLSRTSGAQNGVQTDSTRNQAATDNAQNGVPTDNAQNGVPTDSTQDQAHADSAQAGTQAAEPQMKQQADEAMSRPFTLYDVGKAPEGAQEIERPDESFWHPSSFFPSSVELAEIQYETYDEQGNHIARDSYISSRYDSSRDKGILVELGSKYVDFAGYCRRLQEYWTYDEKGRTLSYRSYKQYGADLERQLYEEVNDMTRTDSADNVADSAGSVPQEVLAAQNAPDMTCTWDTERRRAYITETDYYGTEYEFIHDYDAQGRKVKGFDIQDGKAQLIYEAYFDDKGRVAEIDDNTPRLIKERLADEYRENFYDEALTQPLLPRQSENRYQFYFYDKEGTTDSTENTPAYMLEIDSQDGNGKLYVYQYDEDGRLSVTWLYYIRAAYLGEFSLDTPEGGSLYFSNSHEEYYTYEKNRI